MSGRQENPPQFVRRKFLKVKHLLLFMYHNTFIQVHKFIVKTLREVVELEHQKYFIYCRSAGCQVSRYRGLYVSAHASRSSTRG